MNSELSLPSREASVPAGETRAGSSVPDGQRSQVRDVQRDVAAHVEVQHGSAPGSILNDRPRSATRAAGSRHCLQMNHCPGLQGRFDSIRCRRRHRDPGHDAGVHDGHDRRVRLVLARRHGHFVGHPRLVLVLLQRGELHLPDGASPEPVAPVDGGPLAVADAPLLRCGQRRRPAVREACDPADRDVDENPGGLRAQVCRRGFHVARRDLDRAGDDPGGHLDRFDCDGFPADRDAGLRAGVAECPR